MSDSYLRVFAFFNIHDVVARVFTRHEHSFQQIGSQVPVDGTTCFKTPVGGAIRSETPGGGAIRSETPAGGAIRSETKLDGGIGSELMIGKAEDFLEI